VKNVAFVTVEAEFDLGRLQNLNDRVDDVVLPPWAKSPYDFIFKHMQALVCFIVSFLAVSSSNYTRWLKNVPLDNI